jgi:hypothetical protein
MDLRAVPVVNHKVRFTGETSADVDNWLIN